MTEAARALAMPRPDEPAQVRPATAEPLLSVRDLRVGFDTADGRETTVAVDGVSFDVHRGRVLGLVGESGSGKSVTCLSMLRLLPARGRIVSGAVLFEGRDLTRMPVRALEAMRGRDVAMIFQDPMSSLNPVKRVGWQIAEALVIHEGLGRRAAEARAVELLRLVGIADAPARARSFPHQLSGGMAQRAMIAMALACRPRLLVADEPTTALDVTIQAQILALIDRLRHEIDAAVILITHDLGVVAEIADDVAVMYAGRVVETAPVGALFAAPQHPYTRGLLNSLPGLRGPGQSASGRRLAMIAGAVPAPRDYPEGCRFAPRCDLAVASCGAVVPPLDRRGPGRVACLRPLGGERR